MTQQTQTYRERSHEYLAKAFAELEAGDLTQASEKGWGAAAQIVKAGADSRGLEHQSHRALLLAGQALAREMSGNDYYRALEELAFARDLHTNFYEDVLNASEVEMFLRRVRSLVAKIEGLL